ncbi:MAG: hypothetical protein IT373_03575 [Polyangiaceae bacterium]|nr:hypothetical protein [Polyangiaceae bacterium]
MTSWVGEELDSLKTKADEAVLDDTHKTIDDVQTLLEGGPPRQPVDFEKEKAKFTKGRELSTPDGGDPTAAAPPNDPKGAAPLSATVQLGQRIELIHFGVVHRDARKNFDCAEPLDDCDAELDLTKVVGGRAVAFRAALERETILLACFGQAVEAALDEKDQKEGKTSDLLQVAADLVGGAAHKTADTAVAADMAPFITKLNAVWAALDQEEISYADLHAAGRKLHALRANLAKYLFELIDPKKAPPGPNTPGLLSDLPLVGSIPLPGVLGDAVGFMQKITGKIFDVQMKLSFGLILAMREPIEKACHELTLDAVLARRAPIYPVWYQPPRSDGAGQDQPFAALESPVDASGNLTDIAPIRDAQAAVDSAVSSVNQKINDAVAKPMEVIDFLSTPVTPAPGNPFLADAFQASLGQGAGLPVWQGSEALAELAVRTICTSIVDEVPAFMQGTVGDVTKGVFRVAVEFVRAVYGVLCTYPSVVIDTDALMAAGRKHVLMELINVATDKLGLDALLKDLSFAIPAPPFVPAGINFPTGKELSVAPLVAKLKDILADKLEPYLAPVIDYATSGLATRLTGARAWAGASGLTMEAHLGQLPVEIALLFRHLFGPLWSLVTDTLMGALSDAVAEIMGPAAKGIGYAQDAVGKVEGIIDSVEAKAKHARDYAANVEQKAKDLLAKASSINVGIGNTQDLSDIANAAKALDDAVGADVLGPDAAKNAAVGAFVKVAMFDPSTRKKKGRGKKIDAAELAKVSADHQWDRIDAGGPSAPAAAGGAK